MRSRRAFVIEVGAGFGAALASSALSATGRTIPQHAGARVIVDNDFAGDPDGLVALAHQLLSPKTETRLVTVTPLLDSPEHPVLPGQSIAQGCALAAELVRRAAVAPPPILGGDAAARAIVAEALREDALPLFFTCGGPLTNLAAALRLEPRIANRMTVIWIGGDAYPAGGWEYNLAADTAAAKQVIERSRVPFWQVPQNAYRQVQASVAELTVRLRSASPLGAWLYDRFTDPPAFITVGGSWPLGDSPLVLLTAITPDSSAYVDRAALTIRPDLTYGAPIPGRLIRVFDRIDGRLALEDFFALLRLHATP